jgi:hypothetical protein
MWRRCIDEELSQFSVQELKRIDEEACPLATWMEIRSASLTHESVFL